MQTKPVFYRCGICECLHPWNWSGDCRDDANRFAADKLDSKFGPFGWDEETMENRVLADEEVR